MNFSQQVKAEILQKNMQSACCKIAYLSAYVRSSGCIIKKGQLYGFEITTDSLLSAKYFNNLIIELYGIDCNKNIDDNIDEKNARLTLTYLNEYTTEMLIDMAILTLDNNGIAIKSSIDEYLVENECCKIAYIKGCFIGNGSVTVPKLDSNSTTGYHMEFVFTNYQPATAFCEIFSEMYILSKLIERKNSYVVYIKTVEEILNILELLGASQAVETLTDLSYKKHLTNNANRVINCESNNLTKQYDASIKQIKAISNISNLLGLESLPKQLEVVAVARLEHATATLNELAVILNISKSCLNHRLRKIIEISNNL